MQATSPAAESAPLFVAIDGGATKTEAVLFAADGRVIARALAGPSNPNGSAGDVGESLMAVLEGIGIRSAGSGKGGTDGGTDALRARVAAVGVCVAGGSAEAVQQRVYAILRPEFTADTVIHVDTDALGALFSGVDNSGGLALIAGTGAVVFGLGADGTIFRAGGWGHLAGDEGSGYDLGNRALRAVFAAFDGMGEATALTERLLCEWGVASVPDLVPVLYASGKDRVAALAPLVLEAAEGADAVAVGIVASAAGSLAGLLEAAVLRGRADYGLSVPVRVVTVGGLWRSSYWCTVFDQALKVRQISTAVALVRPQLPPVWGAACWLLARCGIAPVPDRAGCFERSYRSVAAGTVRETALSSGLLSAQSSELSAGASSEQSSRSSSVQSSEPVLRAGGVAGGVLAIEALATEAAAADAPELDALPLPDLVRLLLGANSESVAAALAQTDAIAGVVAAVTQRLEKGGRLFYIGAGTSGRLGILDASECPPTFGVDAQKVQGVIAGGASAILYPSEGAEDDALQAAADLQERGLQPGDALIALAASGRTPYCIGALRHARSLGALAVAFSCNSPAAMSAEADHVIELQTGAEVLAGSTRLKAGTAQKIVLNAISTAVMVRLGRVYGNRMVDMVASNEKLRQRALRMVTAITGVGEAEAACLLEQGGGSIKVAVVMARCGIGAEAARRLLERSGGFVRTACAAAADLK